jgi:hypothetical protein
MSLLEAAWKEIVEYRAQTATWDLTKTVNPAIIQSLTDDIHRRAPSKQNRVQYKMHVFDWSDTEFRNHFYEFAVDRDNPDPRYNSQTLANYLFVFVGRNPGKFDKDFSGLDVAQNGEISHLEIGLAAHMLVHGAYARGLQSGFCKCFDYDYERKDKIIEKLQITEREFYKIHLAVGVGHQGSTSLETYNLHTKQMVNGYKDQGKKWYLEPKPDASEYIIYHTNE